VDLERRVRGLVAEVIEGCSLDRIVAVTCLDGGALHSAFRVRYEDAGGDIADVVVRVRTDPDGKDCVQDRREAAVLGALDGTVSPRLYDSRCESRWFDAPTMCLQFIAGEQRQLGACGPGELALLGAAVRRVHATPVPDLGGHLPEMASLADYVDSRLAISRHKLEVSRASLDAGLASRVDRLWRQVQARGATLRGTLGSDAEPSLLHGDISGDNIVWSPEPVLLDWEFVRLGDPADEIASMFGQNGLTDSQRAAFWKGYRAGSREGRVDAIAQRAVWWEPVTMFGSAMWWLERCAGGGGGDASLPHERGQAVRRLDLVERLLAGGSRHDG
jgi:aminoglycoside phosphotransferase (APT) family kinase protein